MGKFVKNEKFFLPLIIFLLFLSLSIRAQVDCGANCDTCYDKSACNADLDCGWDSVSSKCCRRLEVRWPDSPAGTSISGCTTVTGMVKYFYEWGIALGGLATFFALVMGGFQYLTSMGEPAKITEAKNRISSAIFGLVLLLGSWLILNTINPELTKFKAKLELTTIPPPAETLGTTELTPCEFAYGYKQINWEGKEKKIDISSDPIGFQDLKSYTIYRKREITNLECDPFQPPPENTICVSNPNLNEYCKKNYCLLEPCDPKTEFCCDSTTDPPCSDGYYKAGGACTLEYYYGASWWIIPLPGCGAKIGSLGAPSIADISAYNPNFAETKCVRLVKIITTE